MALFSPGVRLAERYLLDAPIGSGGMSEVWRAVDEVLGRSVAIKTLNGPLAADPGLRSVIRREARAAASIAHPHVAQVYDFGEAPGPGGTPYLVMELLHGHNLAHRLREGPVGWSEAVRVCADVADALAAAHRLNVVHRDIKPANVMLTPTGAKVVDFGIAAVAAGRSTEAGAPRGGTPAYLAPEVLAGAEATAESDVYSLGAVLYEALTGSVPLGAHSWAEANLAHLRGDVPAPVSVPALPAEVRELCARCLSASPAARPTSEGAAEVLARWAVPASRATGTVSMPRPAARVAPVTPTLLDASPPPVRTAPRLVEPPPVRSRSPLAAVAVGFALVGILLIAAAAALTYGPGTRATPGAAGTTTPPVTTPPAPRDPTTTAAALSAIEAAIANALTGGSVDLDTGRDLADGVRDLRERVNEGRTRDLERRAESLRDQLDRRVRDGDLDPAVAAELDHLLDILIQLAGDN